MLIHCNSENMHLKLVGDFDGSSAHMLINSIKKYYLKYNKIFIHTACLREINPFGREVFKKNLCIPNERLDSLFFAGEHAFDIAPYPWQVV
jgi:hypothetical protein